MVWKVTPARTFGSAKAAVDAGDEVVCCEQPAATPRASAKHMARRRMFASILQEGLADDCFASSVPDYFCRRLSRYRSLAEPAPALDGTPPPALHPATSKANTSDEQKRIVHKLSREVALKGRRGSA
jgi:hypothetical protein